MAQKFESLVEEDERFEVAAARHLGMVVFRLKGENDQTEKLLKKLNGSGTMNYFSFTKDVAILGSLIKGLILLSPDQVSLGDHS